MRNNRYIKEIILVISVILILYGFCLKGTNISYNDKFKNQLNSLRSISPNMMKNPHLNLLSKVIISKLPLFFIWILDVIIMYYLMFPLKKELKNIHSKKNFNEREQQIINDLGKLSFKDLTEKYKEEMKFVIDLKNDHDKHSQLQNRYKNYINILINENVFKNLFASLFIFFTSIIHDRFSIDSNLNFWIFFIYTDLILSSYFLANIFTTIMKFKEVNRNRKIILIIIIFGKIFSKFYDLYYLSKNVININIILVSVLLNILVIFLLERLNKGFFKNIKEKLVNILLEKI